MRNYGKHDHKLAWQYRKRQGAGSDKNKSGTFVACNEKALEVRYLTRVLAFKDKTDLRSRAEINDRIEISGHLGAGYLIFSGIGQNQGERKAWSWVKEAVFCKLAVKAFCGSEYAVFVQ